MLNILKYTKRKKSWRIEEIENASRIIENGIGVEVAWYFWMQNKYAADKHRWKKKHLNANKFHFQLAANFSFASSSFPTILFPPILVHLLQWYMPTSLSLSVCNFVSSHLRKHFFSSFVARKSVIKYTLITDRSKYRNIECFR